MNYADIAKSADKAGKSRTITPQYRSLDDLGDPLIGKYVNRALIESGRGGGSYYQYIFDTDNGLVKIALGSLFDRESGDQLAPDNVYRITYNGKEDIGGGKTVNSIITEHIADISSNRAPERDELPF